MTLQIVIPIGPLASIAAPATFLIANGAGGERVVFSGPDLQESLLNIHGVVLFLDAKPVMRHLLALGIDIARPICLKTLRHLGSRDLGQNETHIAHNQDEASNLARNALEELSFLLNDLKARRQLARLENLVLRSFVAMEHHGLHIDGLAWQTHIDWARQNMAQAKDEALRHLSISSSVDLFGTPTLNLDCGKEVKDALEHILGLTLADTHQLTLSRLVHPAAQSILKYREMAKLVQTYGDNFLSHIDTKTSRIHATFEPNGTSTGRVACHTPNLQNLPSDEKFHRCIVAPIGKSLITADYAACELRILASLSRDPIFLEAFARDVDLHSDVASQMFGVPVDKVNNVHLRQRAKAINFGLMYGMGSKSLARSLEISEVEAEHLFTHYFRTYPKIKSFLDECVEKALHAGYAETVLGRRLIFDEDSLHNRSSQNEISRIARNMPIQGTAAEITKLAMLRLHECLVKEFSDAFLVNMIHDELVVECRDQDVDAIAQRVQKEMEDAQISLIPNVKPKADVHVGKYWQH